MVTDTQDNAQAIEVAGMDGQHEDKEFCGTILPRRKRRKQTHYIHPRWNEQNKFLRLPFGQFGWAKQGDGKKNSTFEIVEKLSVVAIEYQQVCSEIGDDLYELHSKPVVSSINVSSTRLLCDFPPELSGLGIFWQQIEVLIACDSPEGHKLFARTTECEQVQWATKRDVELATEVLAET